MQPIAMWPQTHHVFLVSPLTKHGSWFQHGATPRFEDGNDDSATGPWESWIDDDNESISIEQFWLVIFSTEMHIEIYTFLWDYMGTGRNGLHTLFGILPHLSTIVM